MPADSHQIFMREVRRVWLQLIKSKTKKDIRGHYDRLVEQVRTSTPSGQIAAKVLRDILTDETNLDRLFGEVHDSMTDKDIADIIQLRKMYLEYLAKKHRRNDP